ncbi:phosphatidylinositol 4-kinase beta fwd [Arctopsyche grandis]|uniref:phosphatidylinositol 4-kinase beta fwd n=1 Tax=Arctopsyche grandis TaxID=121162 RepID=UPI00406D69E0
MAERVPARVHGGALRPHHLQLQLHLPHIKQHQRNRSLDFRCGSQLNSNRLGALTSPNSGHQRNRSLDSVLQRIPESPAPPCTSPNITTPPLGSDDSGIICPISNAIPGTTDAVPVVGQSRESLDSGAPDTNEEDTSSEPKSCSNESEQYEQSEDKSSSDKGELQEEAKIEVTAAEKNVSRSKDFLLRLFESKLFDMHMAIGYLFNSKEPGVQSYLANKLFSFPNDQVDFYLPQLATMYIEIDDVAEVLRTYLVQRCRASADFSLKLAWLLGAYGAVDMSGGRRNRGAKLRAQLLTPPRTPPTPRPSQHHRTRSDASALKTPPLTLPGPPAGPPALGDLLSGRAFDCGCPSPSSCHCLQPQLHFIDALVSIGKKLIPIATQELRNTRLRAELVSLNLNLPARVWLPLHPTPHYILRIPPQTAAVLNSKDKTPYLLYVEVLEVAEAAPLPARIIQQPAPMRHARSEETLPTEWKTLSVYSPYDDLETEGCWSQEDDELTLQYRCRAADSLSQLSGSSASSRESILLAAADVRRRLAAAEEHAGAHAFRNTKDPSAQALKELWSEKELRVRASSPYGQLADWKLLGAIVKCGDDLRQELLASQLLQALQALWEQEHVPLRLHPCRIVCLSDDSGLISPLVNTVSLHQIRRQSGLSLRGYLQREHGPPTAERFMRAQTCFVRSAAAYALASYLLQLKDRHNGNILLDVEGHLIHIDFAFILSISPKNLGFETSPFKLTNEIVEVMDGEESDMFSYFKILMLQGLVAARKHQDRLLHIVEVMRPGGQLACLRSGGAVRGLRARLHSGRTEAQLAALIDSLVHSALTSISTRLYDKYQYITNGIL